MLILWVCLGQNHIQDSVNHYRCIDGAVNFCEACQGSEYASVSLSLTGEIFTQKRDSWFNKKKRKVYHSLHISEKDKILQSIWAIKCKLICKHLFWVVTLKSNKDWDKGSWLFAHAYSLY